LSEKPTAEISRHYELTTALDEYDVWRADVRPHLLDLPKEPLEIWQICFSEMLNNAIDHSGGKKVLTKLTRVEGRTRILLLDDGIGIFRKIQAAFDLADERQAVLELTKGKLTTDPSKHSGQGIYMTSRMLDNFNILSGGVWFSHESAQEYDWIGQPDENQEGTAVFMELADNTTRTSEEVALACSSSDGLDLDKTMVPVSLAREGNDNLVSRSQAKRLMVRLDRFRSVILDFQGVERIGQAFADEIFRVFTSEHPGTVIIPANANESVVRMIAAVVGSAGK
jgi:anti-sigma regulatory factor (Ser/Thr protein kinase)